MNNERHKNQMIRVMDFFISCLASLGRALTSMRIGHQAGIVISKRSIRLCLVRRRLFRNRVIGTATYIMDPDISGNWVGQIEAAANILKSHLRENRLTRVPINIGLAGEDIAFRRMYLPQMPAGELSAAVLWEGEKIFPFNLNQCQVDHKLVDRVRRNDTDHAAINIVAARRSIIEIFYHRFGSTGLKIGQIGFLPVFIADKLSGKKIVDSEQHNLFLYLDDEQGMAMFVHHGVLEFFQQFVTKPLAHSENDQALANPAAIASELNSFLELYNGQSFGVEVDNIIICGKYATDTGAAAFIANHTGLPCRTTTSIKTLSSFLGYPSGSETTDYLDAITTALAAPGENLLAPVEIREAEGRKRMITRVNVAAALALLVVSSMHIQLYHQEKSGQCDLEYKKVLVEAFEKSPGYLAYVNLMGKLVRDQAYLNKTHHFGESHFNIVLKELTLLLPEHINITSINLEEAEDKYLLQLDGHVRLDGFSPEIVLAEYVETLGASPFFQNVAVSQHDKKREGSRFDLTFQLKMDARV
jgi:Tfp pilus assembly PilM family ATPase